MLFELFGEISTVTGEKSPVGQGKSKKTTDISKENVRKFVIASYDFVINGIKKCLLLN